MDATLYPWEYVDAETGLIVIDYGAMQAALAAADAELEHLDAVRGFELTAASVIDLLTPDAE